MVFWSSDSVSCGFLVLSSGPPVVLSYCIVWSGGLMGLWSFSPLVSCSSLISIYIQSINLFYCLFWSILFHSVLSYSITYGLTKRWRKFRKREPIQEGDQLRSRGLFVCFSVHPFDSLSVYVCNLNKKRSWLRNVLSFGPLFVPNSMGSGAAPSPYPLYIIYSNLFIYLLLFMYLFISVSVYVYLSICAYLISLSTSVYPSIFIYLYAYLCLSKYIYLN